MAMVMMPYSEKGSLITSTELPAMEDIIFSLQSCRDKKDLPAARRVHLRIHGIGLENHFGNYLVPMFVECGSVSDALQTFSRLVSPNEFSWTSIIQGYVECGEPEQAVAMFHAMNQGGSRVDPSRFTFLAMAKACARLKYASHQGLQVHAMIVEEGYEADLFLANTLIDMYSKSGMLLEASDVFDNLEARDTISWNALITGFSEQGLYEEALCFVEVMQSKCITPDVITYVAGLKLCGSTLHPRKGRELHTDLVKRGYENDSFVCSALVDMYAKCESFTEAYRILEQFPRRDVVMWTSLIRGFSEYGHIEDALDCLEKMLMEGLSPDAVTLMCILKGCYGGSVMLGQKMHIEIIKRGFELDPYVTNTLIDMYSNYGLLVEAREVFNKVPIRDVVSWSALIGGFIEHGYGEDALSCLTEMVRENMSPDPVTYVSGLQACSVLGKKAEGAALHAHIVKRGLETDYLIGNTLVDFYCHCDAILDAEKVFETLLVKDTISWNALLVGYVDHNLSEKALHCLKQMQLDGFSPVPVTYIYSLKAYDGPEALEKGRLLHSQIIKVGCDLDHFVSSSLVDMYFRCGSVPEAESVFSKLHAPDHVVWNALLSGFAMLGDSKETLRYYAKMQEQALLPNVVTFVSMLRACSNATDVETGKRVHAQNHKAGGFLASDMVLATSIIDMYGRCGNVHNAEFVFDAIEVGDHIMWTALITAYAQQGESESVFLTFERMKDAGVEPDAITYLHVLSACSHDGLVDKGREYFDSMTRDHGIIPMLEHYNCMVDLLGRAGQLEAISEMLNTMRIEPDEVTWNTLLGACRRWGSIEIGRSAFDCLVKADTKGAGSFVLMSNLYANAQATM